MADRQVTVTVHICDGCESEHVQFPDAEPPLGFYGGSVSRIHGGGGDGCKGWFACRSSCIAKAIQTAIERESRRD